MLIDAIGNEGMNCTLSKRGGRNIALQFAHIHNNRIYRFENYANELLKGESRIDPEYTSIPQEIEIPTTGGRTAYGFFYPPHNKDYKAPEDEKPKEQPMPIFI